MSDTVNNSGISNSITKGESISNPANQRTTGSDLDKDAFLQLLVTQMKYQDPLDPMDNTEMIAQLAQFSSLEQMQNLNTTMTNSQAFSLVGKLVYSLSYNEDTHSYDEIAGVVDSVKIKNNVPYLVIGDKEVLYSEVSSIYNTNKDALDNINSNVVNSQAMSLIGKTIQAITVDDNLKATEFVEGKVDYVKFNDGTPILSIDGKDVYAYEVLSVSDNSLLIGNNITAYTKYDSETGEYESVSGTISKINIKDDKLYLDLNGKEIEINDIASIMDSFTYVGKTVTSGKTTGTVESVVINNKKPYLLVKGELINYTDLD